MLQWRQVSFLAFMVLLTATLAQAGADPTEIRLGIDDSAIQAGVRLTGKSSRSMELHFQAPRLEIVSRESGGQVFQLLNIPGAELDGPEGRPALPLYTQLVAIPDGYTLEVGELSSRKVALEGAFNPWPAQGIRSRDDADFRKDSAYYLGQSPAAPPAAISVGQPGLMRGLRVVPVHFRPVSWDPTDGSAIALAEMDVRMNLVPSADGNNNRSAGRPIPESFARMYEQDVIGFERDAVQVHEGPGTYLIIYPDNSSVEGAIQPLIAWRFRQGYNVLSASTAVTGTSNSSIKNYIQSIYDSVEVPLEFVTLVGDANGSVELATFNEGLSSYGGEGDHEYTLLEGGDVLSDIHIGRLSVSSSTMLSGIVDKIVSYESDPYMDSDLGWFTRAGLTGDPATSGYSCIWVNQWVKEQLLDMNYTQVDTIWGGNFPTLMSQTINQGETLFTYRGYYGMSGMHNGYIGGLSNGRKLPFALILTCDTGSFEGDSRSEAFFQNLNGGGIASIGTATIGTHTRYNNCMFQGVTEGVLNGGDQRVGPGLTRGKLHLYSNYIEREPAKVEIWSTWNNLMGDPATAIFTAIPKLLTVDYPTSVSAGANSLPVRVTDGGLAVEGALVTVYRKGQLQVSGYTDASGNLVLPLSGLTDGGYLVTVTGRNLKPHQGGFNVGSLPVSVDLAGVTIDDDNLNGSSGNGDGLINPGETVELLVDLGNSGTGGAADVSARLASHDLQVSVLQGDANYGFIASGGTATALQSYVVSIGTGVPGGGTVSLPLTASSGAGEFVSLLDLEISGPSLSIASNSVGALNPGSNANVSVELINTGNLPTGGVAATLTSDSRWVSVVDGDCHFGAMTVGGSAGNGSDLLTIAAGAECYPGHTATLKLELTFQEGGTMELPLLVTVGSVASTDPVGPDHHGYYGFDNTDTGYDLAPTYDWIEIAPTSGGQGTSVGLTDFDRYDDDVVIMDLPFDFTYYGKSFSQVSICSNGWIAFGRTDNRQYRNWSIPTPAAPDNMVAVYWDDLEIGSGDSGVYQWYDAANHRLIIQWDNMANAWTGVRETFQVILLDPEHGAGDTEDGIITMNYQDVTATDGETGYATVGIQNADRTDGVLYTYYELYPAGAASLADGRSITFRTVIPQAQGTLTGLVTNSVNGEPVDGATISMLGTGLEVLTAEDGRFTTSLSLGSYSLAVNHPSFAPDTTHNVVIAEDVVTTVDFSLNDNAGPTFTMLSQPESTDDTTGPYEIQVEIRDFSGIDELHGYYTSSTAGGPFEMSLQPTGDADTYRALIPGQESGSRVQYWLTGTDIQAQFSTMPAGAPFAVYSFMVAATDIIYSSAMETQDGWVGGISGDDASSGVWELVNPNRVTDGSQVVVPEDDHTTLGVNCWVTGQDPTGSEQGVNDIDGGTTTLESPVFEISGRDGVEVQYFRWYTNDTGLSPGEDTWLVQARDASGSWVNLENTTASDQSWQEMNFLLNDHMDLAGTTQFRFIASDLYSGSVVEALVDDFTLAGVTSIVDEEAPVVSLLSPVGGGSWAAGSEQTISWTATDDIGVVQVDVLWSSDGGESYTAIASGPLAGSTVWTVPGTPGDQNRIRIVAFDSTGQSRAAESADFTITSGPSGVGDVPAGRITLAQNHPNPFNPRTEISYSLPRDGEVSLRVYNLDGRLVRTLVDGRAAAGAHTVIWSGKNEQGGQVASGLYFYRLITDSGTMTRKMTLLK